MENYLSGTKFELELANALIEFIPRHMEECLAKPELEYDEYGTEAEKKLKSIFKFYSNIGVVLRDLGITLNFLEKERALILKDYPFLESQETYYKYHYENYIIRLVTILDLIGKLGTLIYDLGLDLEKVSSYTFKDKARKEGYNDIAEIVDKLTDRLGSLKFERHKKLHTGEADIRLFKGTVIWEDLNAILGSDTSEILKEFADEEIKKKIGVLKESTFELIDIVKAFLEESKTKLNEIIVTRNNT
jgi:hypothetical protein